MEALLSSSALRQRGESGSQERDFRAGFTFQIRIGLPHCPIPFEMILL
jgi:hypothetical protein